ncbi:hypothetical protein M9H77_31208 [Catharanthus roseus]|uniref:Uncharacterized protein n=1 Tax=Catharanthus roseus TaxID=4058 RepID=A0ACC0A0D8_CATRO|nr:hypothetical protein M9H77_31208 [Catharanthus roseus]
MPIKTIASSKRARITDPSSLETDPHIPSFPVPITHKSNKAWFETRKKTRIELEQTIDPTLDNQLEISNLFTTLWSSRTISKSGIYYSLLVKEFYTNITQKNNKDLINIKTTVKGVNITLDRTLHAHIASIHNTSLEITFGSTSRIIFGNKAWEYSEEQVTATSSDIINGDTISQSDFEYNETKRRWIARSGLSRQRTFVIHVQNQPDALGKVLINEE